jgi:hypothetical protein
MVLIGTGILVAITFLIMVGEVYYERDWPRATWKPFVISLGLFAMCLIVFT